MQVQPYLFFEGRCEEALEFYAKAIGAKVALCMRFKDSPDQSMCAPTDANKVMHAQFHVGSSLIMASDGRCTGSQTYAGFALSIAADTAADAERFFAALSEGGQVQMPLTKTFFSEKFGMCADKFGVGWMIIVGQK